MAASPSLIVQGLDSECLIVQGFLGSTEPAPGGGQSTVIIQGMISPYLISQGYGIENPGPPPTPPSGGNPGVECGINIGGVGPSSISVEIGMEIL